jgi:hypothetical protein
LEEDVISLTSYAWPPIHSLVFLDTVGRSDPYNLVHQHQLISEHISPAIPSLRTVQLDTWTKWTKEFLLPEGAEESERKVTGIWRPYIPLSRLHSIQSVWKYRTHFHDYDNCFTRLLGLDTLPASESSPNRHFTR